MASETFTTRYVLDDSNYQAGANRVVQASAKAGNAAASAANKAKSSWAGGSGGSKMGGAAMNALEGIGEWGAKIAGLFGAATIGVATYAVKLASSFDTIERSFLGVLGSWDKVKAMMDYLVAYSGPSLFEVEPLAQAASLLARIRLDVQRWLPIAEMLAIGGGNVSEGGLQDVIALMMRAKGGQLTEATGANEGVGRFGISREDLSKRGAKFDKSGRFLGSVEDFFNILEKTVTEKLGKVRDAMAGGLEATWSSAMTELKLTLVDMGKVIAQEVTPFVVMASKALKSLRDSGLFANAARGMMQSSLIHALLNPSPSQNPLIKAAVFVATIFETLPALSKDFVTVLVEGLNKAVDLINIFGSTMVKVGNIQSNILNALTFGRAHLPTTKWTNIDHLNNPAGTWMAGMGAMAFSDKYKQNMGALGSPLGAAVGIPNAPFTGEPFSTTGGMNAAEETAKATRETADNTAKMVDMRRNILGGGDLGRMGLTGEQLGGIVNRPEVTVNVKGDLNSIIQDTLRKLASQGFKLVKA